MKRLCSSVLLSVPLSVLAACAAPNSARLGDPATPGAPDQPDDDQALLERVKKVLQAQDGLLPQPVDSSVECVVEYGVRGFYFWTHLANSHLLYVVCAPPVAMDRPVPARVTHIMSCLRGRLQVWADGVRLSPVLEEGAPYPVRVDVASTSGPAGQRFVTLLHSCLDDSGQVVDQDAEREKLILD